MNLPIRCMNNMNSLLVALNKKEAFFICVK